MSKPTKPQALQEPESTAVFLVALAKRIEAEATTEKLKALPQDGAINHDHYLYGAKKKNQSRESL